MRILNLTAGAALLITTAMSPAFGGSNPSVLDATGSTEVPQPDPLKLGDSQFDTLTPLDMGSRFHGSSLTPYAPAMSDDGSVIGGWQIDERTLPEGEKVPIGYYRNANAATIWGLDGKASVIDLSKLNDAVLTSRVSSVSGDGSVVIGTYTIQSPSTFDKTMAVSTRAVSSSRFLNRGWVRIGDDAPVDVGQLADPEKFAASTTLEAVSRNGSVVVGSSEAVVPIESPSGGPTTLTATLTAMVPVDAVVIRSGLKQRAVRWTERGGLQSLGVLRADGFGRSGATGVSDDGTVIIGYSEQIVGGAAAAVACMYCTAPVATRAFRWEKGVMTELEGLIGDDSGFVSYTDARDISGDGSVIVGTATSYALGFTPGVGFPASTMYMFGSTTPQAVKWDKSGVTGLGYLSTHEASTSSADYVNTDGSVIIGWSSSDIVRSTDMYSGNSYFNHAFRWTQPKGLEDLGTLAAKGRGDSYVNGLSADGSVIVGVSDTDGVVKFVDETVPSETFERSVRRGFVWTEGDGMQEVGTLRDVDNLGESSVDAISRDGTVIVGTSDTNNTVLSPYREDEEGSSPRLFIMRLIEEETPADSPDEKKKVSMGPMLDLQNTQRQIGGSSQQQSRGMGQLAGDLTGALDGELDVGTGGDPDTRVSSQGRAPLRIPVAVNVTALHTRAGSGLTTNNIRAQGAVGLTPYLTFGGFVQMGQQANGIAGIDFNGNLRATGAYLRGGQRFGQGLTWRLAYGQAQGTAEISRISGFASTEIGVGSAKIKATALKAELGYGYTLRGAAMNSFMRVSKSTASRSAFVETAGATFPISYDAFDLDNTTLTIGTDARFQVSRKGALTLGLSIDKDVNSSNNPITGSSAIPGFINFSVAGPTVVNDTRATLSATYEHTLGSGKSIVVGAYAGQARYDSKMASGISVGYTARW